MIPSEGKAVIGITTTIPVEVVFAAGLVPVDLNNAFVAAPDAAGMVERAERAGFPHNTCSWIKGIYQAVLESGIRRVIGVIQGDCSNTEALLAVLAARGVEVIPFSYPYPRSYRRLKDQIEELMGRLRVDWPAVDQAKRRLDWVRGLVRQLDELTWRQGTISGWENHLYCISCSDFQGDADAFEGQVKALLEERGAAQPSESAELRLGYVGVPPIYGDLYQFLEERGARVVYNEMQWQFTMPHDGDLVRQYLAYTYPYGAEARLEAIGQEVQRRRVQGLIHYVQSFCHHQIEDILLRERVKVPILTLEGDRPGPLELRSKNRLEAFLEALAK